MKTRVLRFEESEIQLGLRMNAEVVSDGESYPRAFGIVRNVAINGQRNKFHGTVKTLRELCGLNFEATYQQSFGESTGLEEIPNR